MIGRKEELQREDHEGVDELEEPNRRKPFLKWVTQLLDGKEPLTIDDVQGEPR